MKNANYVVKRDDINVGSVAFSKLPVKEPSASVERLRRIYFVLDEKGYAVDLLNDVSNYPTLLYNDLFDYKKPFVPAFEMQNIGNLLKLYGFPTDMTYEDVLQIDKFFKYGWKFDNASYFGFYKPLQGDNASYSEIDHRFNKFRSYINGGEASPLPKEYFDLIWKLSNLWDTTKGEEIDFSLPRSKEEMVRKLTK